MPKKIIKVDNRPKVFNIETYRNCEITEDHHQRKFICTFPKGDSFEFSIDINRSSFKPDFECIYKTEHGQGVVLYRAEPNDHIIKFWHDLGNEYHARKHGYQDELRNKILAKFDFNWRANNYDY